ncbi:putative synaptojanin (N-terminal domain), putative,inositol/phosphatidylinositol phosphatase [Trypanosoma grayi]|uniref:putative synaptojanin (N-terminal domain), putative,inositol/phosphatidylinositol phosphatase n=1 Tax=Trypanosoma grayi TaxID=71804 RepID=UPI0004F4A670|nr:putative synaptojanin (N-terminal domain), putative,inositol/phosphatidylinositol phosphatase [Trypanosoma grayi]KEG09999.1 putative synaptojanin (N-terminal domain), putative,inositol/phosphatidylinositol phosphatase [Trypanosoma grayi]
MKAKERGKPEHENGHRDCDHWHECDASLHPAHRLPLDSIFLYGTSSRCCVIGTDATRRDYHVLDFTRSNSDTLRYDVTTTYTSDDIESLVAHLKREPNVRVLRAKALLGCVRFTRGYYLLLATRRRCVARLGFHRIFEVADIELVSLCAQETTTATAGVGASPLLPPRTVEDYYRNQFLASSLKQNFYYSHTYDLTNTLQTNMTVPFRERKLRDKFVWNEFLVEPLFTPFTTRSAATEEEALLSPAGIGQWTVHLVHGSVVQCPVWCNSRPLLVTLIGRVSKNFAGARYLRRGVSSDGHVANHVEVEQIVVDESTLHTHFTRGGFTSYVQVRGSVPLHWFHPPTQLPKPPIKLGVTDLYYTDTRKHFQELLEDYGAPLIIMNLLRQREKRPRETLLSSEYRKVVAMLKGLIAREEKVREDEEVEEILLYDEFDIREAAHDAWNNTTALAEGALEKTGFFACNSSGTRVRRQDGVVRSNCVDCVDRTNLAQFFFGLHALGHQLGALGLLHAPVDISLSPGVQDLLLRMYLLMGDAIAVQYGGSPQVGAGVLNRGTGWDKIMGIKRLYNNMVGDREKQSVLNLFLGRYQPYPSMHSAAPNPVMRIPGANDGGGGGHGRSSISSNVRDERASTARYSLPHVGPEGRVGRVVDLSEIESDYYLQVKSAPSLAKPDLVTGWWKEPLRRFHLALHRRRTTLSPSRQRVADAQEAEDIRRMCLRERAAALVVKQDADADTGESGGCVALQDGEVFLLVSTTPLTTLVRRTMVLPCRQLPLGESILLQDLMKQSGIGLKSVSHDTGLQAEEMLHDYCTYPAEVRASIFYRDIEAVRRLCDQCEPPDELRRMQMAVLTKNGDPADWNTETVVEALMDVEPEVNASTINYLRQMNVDGYTLLYQLSTELMGQKVILSRFVELLRQLPRASLENARVCLQECVVSTEKMCDAEGGSDLGQHIAFPDITCRILQPFFQEALYPATVGSVVRLLLQEMTDEERGVPRSNRLRYREKTNQRVPPAVVALNSFNAKELHQWLLRESRRLGLTLHQYVERHEASQVGWKFLLWLAHASLVTRIIIEPAFGVFVQPAIKLNDFASRTNLFTLRSLEEVHVLNRISTQRGGRPADSGGGTPPLADSAAAYAESLVSLALDMLSSLQEMVIMTGSGDSTHDSALRAILNSVAALSSHLMEVDLTAMRSCEQWCFWANVFNALYIHAWLAAPGKRVQDYTSFYTANGYEIGGYFFSLNDIKNGILRGNKPAPFSLLPPFESGDPRLLFVPADIEEALGGSYLDAKRTVRTASINRMQSRILITLIDCYLVPDKFENVSLYSPRTLFNEEDQAALDATISISDISIVATDANESDNDNPNDGGDEDPDARASPLFVGGVLRRATGFPVGAANWFSSWFGHRQVSKTSIFTHPCLPLVAATLPEQMYLIEDHMLRSLSNTSQAMVMRNGVLCPRSVLPLLIYPEEFGATTEEIIRSLHHTHMNAAGKKQQLSASVGECESPLVSVEGP